MADTDRYAIGLEYTMELTLTPLVPKDQANKPIVTEKVFLDSLTLSYIDSGPIDVVVGDSRSSSEVVRPIRSDYGNPLGQIPIGTNLPTTRVYTETGRRLAFARGRSEDIDVKIRTSTHLGTRIAAILQKGTVTPNG